MILSIRSVRSTFLVSLLPFLMLACGGDDSGSKIGAAGGTVASEDGLLSLTIPAGALASDVNISISRADDPSDPLVIAGTGYRIEAPATTLAQPANLAFTLTKPVTAGLSTARMAVTADCSASTPQCTYPRDLGTFDPAHPPTCPDDHPVLISSAYSAELATEVQTCGLQPASQPTLFSSNLVIGASSYDVGTNVLTSALVQLGDTTIATTYDTTPPAIPDFWATVDGTLVSIGNPITVPPSVNVSIHVHATDNVAVRHLAVASHGGVTYAPFQPIETPDTHFSVDGPDYDFTVVFNNQIPGTYFYEAQAVDFAGNSSSIVPLTLYVQQGTSTPQPYVSLSASPASITADGDTTLTATSSGVVTVTKVEFFEGATKLGEDTSAPFTQVVSYTEANNGTHIYYAKATASDLTTDNSNNATVDVSIGVSHTNDWYVDPVAGDDANAGTSLATAFKTICKAAQVATAGQTIALADGSYDSVTQRPTGWSNTAGCGPTFGVSVNVAALNQGQAVIAVPLAFSAGGGMSGLKLARDAVQGSGQTTVSAGTVTITALTIADMSSVQNGLFFPLVFDGGDITMTPGGASNVFTMATPAGKTQVLAKLGGSAHLTLNGMTIDAAVAFASADDGGCGPLIQINGSNTVTLNGTTIRHNGQILNSQGAGATLAISSNSVLENHSTHAGNSSCSPVIDVNYAVTMTASDSTLRGTVGGAGGSGVGLHTNGNFTGSVTLTNMTFESFAYSSNGGAALNLAGSTSATASVSLDGCTISSSDYGLYINGGMAVSARNTTIQNSLAYGARLTSSNSSTLDLGTSGSPGGNVFINSTQSHVRNESTAIVDAAGNTWTANIQSADANGHYAAALVAGPASGANYNLTGSATKIQF